LRSIRNSSSGGLDALIKNSTYSKPIFTARVKRWRQGFRKVGRTESVWEEPVIF
jgi:hypothetical protein